MEQRFRGKVVWFNNGKGYGFIARDGGPDVFVHHSGIQAEGYRTLKQDDQVEFSIVTGPNNRQQAEGVVRVEI